MLLECTKGKNSVTLCKIDINPSISAINLSINLTWVFNNEMVWQTLKISICRNIS